MHLCNHTSEELLGVGPLELMMHGMHAMVRSGVLARQIISKPCTPEGSVALCKYSQIAPLPPTLHLVYYIV